MINKTQLYSNIFQKFKTIPSYNKHEVDIFDNTYLC